MTRYVPLRTSHADGAALRVVRLVGGNGGGFRLGWGRRVQTVRAVRLVKAIQRWTSCRAGDRRRPAR
jgi:hypothetical protein